LGVKDTLKPLQANLKVGISRFGARILPFRGGEGCPVALVGGSWLDNYRVQKPTICRYALNGSNRGSLNTRASIVSHVILTYKDSDRA